MCVLKWGDLRGQTIDGEHPTDLLQGQRGRRHAATVAIRAHSHRGVSSSETRSALLNPRCLILRE